MIETMLPAPVPTGLHTAVQVNAEARGHPFLDPYVDFDKALQRRDSRDSGASRHSRGSDLSRQSSSQIEVPLQVVSSSFPEVSPPMVDALDLIARARQDLTAPLPPQLDSQQSGRFLHRGALPQQAQPGSLRCTSQASSDVAFAGTIATPASNGSAGSSSSLEASLAELQHEKQQLVEWGEGLVNQVNCLHQEKVRMEQIAAASAAAASASKRQIEEENVRLRRWGSELEQQVNISGAAGKENEDLRKQLAAYAVEIDDLRENNEKTEQSRREAEDAVSRLTEEKEELQRQVVSIAWKDEAQVEAPDHSGTKDVEEQAEANIGQLHAEVAKDRDISRALASEVKSWSDSYLELQEAFVAQTRDFGKFVTRGKEQHRQGQEELQAARLELDKKMELLEHLQMELALTQQRHAQSSRWWKERMSHQAGEVQADAADAEERVTLEKLRTEERLEQAQREIMHDFEQEKLEMQERLASESALRQKLEEELRRRDKFQQGLNCQRQLRLSKDRGLLRLEKALEKNIARDMFELHRGTILEKVHERNCRREPRLVVVVADEMQMRWSKTARGLSSRSQSRLDLYEVIRIHYGSMARACVLHTDVPPWLCFSLHTSRRSYDFCCPDEEAVQRFVLGLSRLCDWASGTIPTRSRFVALRAWCKLEDRCFHEQISLGRLFIDALDRMRDAPGRIGYSQSPPEPPA